MTESEDTQRPDIPYWDDPVYRHLSGLHRIALAEGANVAELDALMQSLIDGSITDVRYEELQSEASSARKQKKQDRKSRQKPGRPRSAESPPAINTANLKKRIFNPSVSKENMIKAIEALPPAERRKLIEGLSPGFKRKLGGYLTSGKH